VPTFEIRVTGTGPLVTNAAVATRFDQAVQDTLIGLGQVGHRLVDAKTPVGVSAGSGGLRGSLFSQLRGTSARREEIISSALSYAPIVEVGRHAGRRPPRDSIALWLTRKIHVPAKDLTRATFLVARKIGRSGSPGAHMFEQAAAQLGPIVQQRFQALVDRIESVLE